MRLKHLFLSLGLIVCTSALAATALLNKPADPYFAEFHPLKSSAPAQHLKKNDRLAICGDSITEQKMYSRIMETYLTVCTPELNVSVRQFGWGGEHASGFLARMTNDCLRFEPTIATTCYGMNDHQYQPYKDRIGRTYRENSTAIVKAFKAHGARVVLGSPGCVGRKEKWSAEALNLSLCNLRNIDVEIAEQEKVGFADVFWPMLTSGFKANAIHGNDYTVAGKDAVHPGWAGHAIMAYAFLHALGLDGDIGTFTVDLKSNKARVSKGHKVVSCRNGEIEVRSFRYPFVVGDGDPAKDDNILSGTTLVPFNQELNRLMLVVKHPQAAAYQVTWGEEKKIFSAEQLTQGINLAAEFPRNPFSDAFKRVDQAVAAKQDFETKQIKKAFRSAEAKADMEGVAARTEQERASLVAAVKAAFVPVTHTLKISPQYAENPANANP
jgi:hypothetical protein